MKNNNFTDIIFTLIQAGKQYSDMNKRAEKQYRRLINARNIIVPLLIFTAGYLFVEKPFVKTETKEKTPQTEILTAQDSAKLEDMKRLKEVGKKVSISKLYKGEDTTSTLPDTSQVFNEVQRHSHEIPVARRVKKPNQQSLVPES